MSDSQTTPAHSRSPSPMGDEASYDIYARQLLPRKHGHALWLPEHTKHGEVQIGDVGYLMDGGFYRLFNATEGEDQEYGVPDNHDPFKIKKYLQNETKDVIQGSLVSKGVRSYEISGNAESALQAVGAGLKFTCEQQHGAFIVAQPSADRSQLHPSKSLVQYIRTHIDGWSTFASNDLDLAIRPEQVIFVSGAVKTDDWGIGVFVHHVSGGEVSFQANLGPFAQGRFQASFTKMGDKIADFREKRVEARVSPPLSAISDATGETMIGPSSSSLSLKKTQTGPKKDQCLFLNYYKMKKRLWIKRVIKAAAGPDEREYGSGSDGEGDISFGSESDDDVEHTLPAPFDPVDYLLDYILDYTFEDGTQVEAAIAGTDHLYALFDDEFPDDIPAALQKMKPPILFVDDGVAALACAEWREEFSDAEEAERALEKQKAREGGSPSQTGPTSPQRKKNAGPLLSPTNTEEHSSKGGRTGATGAAYETVKLEDHTGAVMCVAWSPDGRYIATGSEDHTICLRDGTSGQMLYRFSEHNYPIHTLAFSPDGRHLATGDNNGTALVLDVEARAVQVVLDGLTGAVQSIQFSSDGSKIVTSSVDQTVRIWDAVSGQELLQKKENEPILTAALSPDGKWLASTCHRDAKIWDAGTGELVHTLKQHKGLIWALDFDPKSRRLVTGSDDGMNIVWKVEDGAALVIIHEHPAPVWTVAFSPDGKQVLSASNDMTVKLCDSFEGKLQHTFDCHDALAHSAVFSPDGRFVASTGSDNEVLVWNARTGKALPPMRGHEDRVNMIRFSPDSDRLVTGSDDSSVRLWTLLLPEDEEDGGEE